MTTGKPRRRVATTTLYRTCTALLLLLWWSLSIAALDGIYHGTINGTPSTLRLMSNQGRLEGEIDAGGYRYRLTGTSVGAHGQGVFSDPNTGGSGQFEARKQGHSVTLKIRLAGQPQPLALQFRENTAADTPSGAEADEQQAQSIRRDSALIGRWRHSDSMTSGTYSGVVQNFLTILPNGVYRLGEGEFAGGGPGVSGVSRGGDVVTGQWRTENRIVYIKEQGSPQWTPYARYYVEANKLMFTFADRSRQIWYRVY